MRRCLSVLVLLGLAASGGCGSDANPVAPTPVVLPLDVRITTTAQTLDGGGTLPLTARVTGAKAQGPLTYRWSGTGGSFVDNAVRDATWQVPVAQPSVRNYTLRITVTDAAGATATDTVVFTVGAAWPVRPVDPRFDDAFWSELVYGGTDYSRSRVLVDPGRLNVYVDVSSWPDALPQGEWLPWIERQWSGWIRTMTGEPWTGRLESGPERNLMGGGSPGWIVIQWKGQLAAVSACGTAPIGNWPDRGYLTLRFHPHCRPWSRYMTNALPHELGHVLGFSHVSDPRAVMHLQSSGSMFTAREQFHMQLAYEVGRDRPYCGWPYSPSC